ncbi:MAG: uracil-DNA glycosylase [Bdellovibrionales bacterium]|nr:uracil-DNA glycosylase [Bdellovibrionales bacterium]
MASTNPSVQIEPSWKKQLGNEFEKDYMKELRQFLAEQYKKGKIIYPKTQEYFAAFDHTPFPDVKVVILGQDPYHGPGQAHGLCFSVRPEVRVPPSLVNIYKELKSDLGIENKGHGYLEHWADQGVLLLNSVLTVESGQAASHRNKGWETFTDRVIEILNERELPMVFMLWGSYAQKKAAFVDRSRHLILEAPHPSPLSASRGFFGCRHFSKANDFLIKTGQAPIDWELPPGPNH